MVELETRELEYFVATAQELHFGRAAERLSIAQPALSKAIQRLETRLGVQLLIRSSRSVALTPAGAALLEHGHIALNAVNAAVINARRAADNQAKLRLVIKPGGDANLLSGIVAAYAKQPDARQVEVLFGGNTDRADYLRDGRAEVGLLYLPFDDTTDLLYETLYVEGRVAVLPDDHRLADRTELRLAELSGEPMPRWDGLDNAGATGPEIADLGQLIHLVALGRTIAVLPHSLVGPTPPGLVCVPVTDAPTSQLVLAWSQADRSPLTAAFVAAAKTTARASSLWATDSPAADANQPLGERSSIRDSTQD